LENSSVVVAAKKEIKKVGERSEQRKIVVSDSLAQLVRTRWAS
jgi:hypothetical protein